ncbi:MAG: RnfABCDGE type electron transport complex subunit D, partial [Alistipes sp.]
MANKFFVSPSPHVHGDTTTRGIMADVILALIPALVVSTWVFGFNVLLITAVS